MRATHLLCLLTVLSFNQIAVASEDGADAEQIKKLVPAATAMSRQDFTAMATNAQGPSEDQFEDKSLTLMIYTLGLIGDDEKAKAEFQFLGDGLPSPADMANETLRSRFGAATVIHADRITDFTCEVDGDKANGTISFLVPDLYQGKVQYVAAKVKGKWKIVEFNMPACKIQIVRNESGKWEKK